MFSRRSFVQLGTSTTALIASAQHFATYAETDDPEADGQAHIDLFHQNLPELPEADEGEIEIVLVGHADSRYVGILIHNASDETVGLDNASGIARGTDGTEIETVLRASFAPYILNPGNYGLGIVMLEDSLDPEDDYEFELELTTEEPNSGFSVRIDIPVTELEVNGNSVSGSVENTSEHVASDLIGVRGLFFNEDGSITGWFTAYLSTDVEPGETGRYTNGHVIGEATDSWILAGSGMLR